MRRSRLRILEFASPQEFELEEKVFSEDFAEIEGRVKEIIDLVRSRGDAALVALAAELDGVSSDEYEIKLERGFIQRRAEELPSDRKLALDAAYKNIASYHALQRQDGWVKEARRGVQLGFRVVPIRRVGIYVPGGLASYPSSLLMNAIPARIAGVREICVATPAYRKSLSPALAYALCKLDIGEVYAIGGAQAVAALAYGTESVKKVDKIVGPGNIYFTVAKKLVYGDVGVDALAGPSEVLIYSNDVEKSKLVAWDMLAQAEHDELARVAFVTLNRNMACAVSQAIEELLASSKDLGVAGRAIERGAFACVLRTRKDVVGFINRFAPEHLELLDEEDEELIDQIENAGAIFLGAFSPVAMGDYVAGTNHVLPTSGGARYSSMLSVRDFVKVAGLVKYSPDGFRREACQAISIAESEGLIAHAASVRTRLEVLTGGRSWKRKQGA